MEDFAILKNRPAWIPYAIWEWIDIMVLVVVWLSVVWLVIQIATGLLVWITDSIPRTPADNPYDGVQAFLRSFRA